VTAAPTAVTAAAVTFSDPYGSASDTYTVPSTTGVDYQVGGVTVPAGTYPGTGEVTVTAVAQAGYALSGTSTWSHTFTDVQPATAEEPTRVDDYGTADDTYTVPGTPGVRYQVGGADVAAGTYPHTAGTDLVVTAVAADGYELTGPSSWTLAFTDITLVSAEEPTRVDDYGTADDTYTIPSTTGVRYQVGGADVAAGTYPHTAGTDLVVTAVAQAGFELTGPDTFPLEFTDLRAVSPVAPGQQDKGGTAHDTYTLPAVAGITYLVDGQPVAPGTHPGTGTVVVTVAAAPGYALDGPSTFTLVFDPSVETVAVGVPDLDVVPTQGSTPGTYTIPAIEGVRFFVDGEEVQPGTYTGTGRVVVTMVADEGYELAGSDELIFDLGRMLSVVGALPVRPGTPAGGTGRTEGTADPTAAVRDEEQEVITAAAPVRAGTLARTGAGAGPVLAASALLTAAGVVLVAASRRRARRG